MFNELKLVLDRTRLTCKGSWTYLLSVLVASNSAKRLLVRVSVSYGTEAGLTRSPSW